MGSTEQLIKDIYHVDNVNEQQEERFCFVLSELDPREERIIRLRYGLDDGFRRTYGEIAKDFGVSAQRIQQIYSRAIKKLRHPTRKNKVLGGKK